MNMNPTARVQAYLTRADLDRYLDRSASIVTCIHGLMGSLGELPQVRNLDEIYCYQVPMLSEDGTCSLTEEMSPTPYDLTSTLGGRSDEHSRRLLLLNQLVLRASALCGADWLGVYQTRKTHSESLALVKLAYFGRPSRAEFPLTREFAKDSTNSTVGLEGSARVIDDVAAYQAEGGGFYVCDDTVQSEACLPIFDDAGHILGIVDCEAQPKGFFIPERIEVLVAVAMLAPAMLPTLSAR